MNQKNKSKLLLNLFWILFITGVSLITFYYITEKTNECTSDPFNYGIEKLKNNLEANVSFIYGNVKIILEDGRSFNEPFGNYNISFG